MIPNFSKAEENYIKSIFHLEQQSGSVTTNELATVMQTKPASVTDMLKKLKARHLLHYKPYASFNLSAEGKKLALNIIRRHRLWEFFLVEKLQFGWDEVHDVAEELEHVGSSKLIDKLDAFLAFPKFDPHGDPIPDANGKMSLQKHINLTILPENKPAEVTAVGGQLPDLLEMLKQKNIHIGTKILIKKKFVFDSSLEIKINNKPVENISEQLAKSLYVKPI